MHILVLCDDRWHPAAVLRAGLAPLAATGFHFDWIEHASAWSAARMAEYPLVILSKSNHVSASDHTPWVSAEVAAAFRAYVQAGNGLLALHSGTAGYIDVPILRSLLGGVFLSHPAQCAVEVVPQVNHHLTTNCAPFTLFDEHYHMELDDAQADVFLDTRSEHSTQPGGWTRHEGAGRVAVLTPAHNLESWLHPVYQILLHNTIRWCNLKDGAV